MSWVDALLISAYFIGFARYTVVIFNYSRNVRRTPVAEWDLFQWVAMVATVAMWPLLVVVTFVTWVLRRLTT